MCFSTPHSRAQRPPSNSSAPKGHPHILLLQLTQLFIDVLTSCRTDRLTGTAGAVLRLIQSLPEGERRRGLLLPRRPLKREGLPSTRHFSNFAAHHTKQRYAKGEVKDADFVFALFYLPSPAPPAPRSVRFSSVSPFPSCHFFCFLSLLCHPLCPPLDLSTHVFQRRGEEFSPVREMFPPTQLPIFAWARHEKASDISPDKRCYRRVLLTLRVVAF